MFGELKMDEIKSAREIAMEKIARLDEPTDEERLKWKYVPEGEKLAARYLEGDFNLAADLGKYEKGAVRYVKEGISGILIGNINLPGDELASKNNRKAMDGLKDLKNDKVAVENVYSKMRQIFSHYSQQGAQQKEEAYEQLKTNFGAQLQQAMQQQLGNVAGLKINVERHPQFQEEWRRVSSQLNSQYLTLLNEYKQELLDIN